MSIFSVMAVQLLLGIILDNFISEIITKCNQEGTKIQGILNNLKYNLIVILGKLLTSKLLYKEIKLIIYSAMILPVVFYECIRKDSTQIMA